MCTSKRYFLSSCELVNCSCISSHYRCYLLVLLYLSRLLTCTSLVVSGRCNSHKDSPLLNIALDNHRTQVLSVSLQSLVYWQKAKSDTTRPKSSQLLFQVLQYLCMCCNSYVGRLLCLLSKTSFLS